MHKVMWSWKTIKFQSISIFKIYIFLFYSVGFLCWTMWSKHEQKVCLLLLYSGSISNIPALENYRKHFYVFQQITIMSLNFQLVVLIRKLDFFEILKVGLRYLHRNGGDNIKVSYLRAVKVTLVYPRLVMGKNQV